MERRKKTGFTSVFLITDHPSLREAGTEEIRQILRASAAVHKYPAGEMHMCELFFCLFRKNDVAAFFELQHISAEPSDKEKTLPRRRHFRSLFQSRTKLSFLFTELCT